MLRSTSGCFQTLTGSNTAMTGCPSLLPPSCLLSTSPSSPPSHLPPEHPTSRTPQGHGHPRDRSRVEFRPRGTSRPVFRVPGVRGRQASGGPVIQCGRLPVRLLRGLEAEDSLGLSLLPSVPPIIPTSPTLPGPRKPRHVCDPIDGTPPGSTVPGILQARILEWVAISFSNAPF